MDKNTKIKLVTGGAAALALAVALGATAAIGASRVLASSDERQAVIDDAAAELGVEPSALENALQKALANRVDEAVEEGRLTEEQGAELKQRIESGDVPFLFGGLGRRGGFLHEGRLDSLQAAATYTGLSETELREQVRAGKSLAEIAKGEGKSVSGLVDAMVAAAKKKLDEAVADGRLTRERADEIEASLEERITNLVNAEPGTRRFGLHPGFRHGFGPHGSRPFAGPDS
jgi:hypothetical protein